jgi:hypothetical protein
MIRVCKAKTSDRQDVSQVTARKMRRETMADQKVDEACAGYVDHPFTNPAFVAT